MYLLYFISVLLFSVKSPQIAEDLEKASEKSGDEADKLSIMNYHDANIAAVIQALGLDLVTIYPYFLASLHFQLYRRNSDGKWRLLHRLQISLQIYYYNIIEHLYLCVYMYLIFIDFFFISVLKSMTY